jgi:hypothetical protein
MTKDRVAKDLLIRRRKALILLHPRKILGGILRILKIQLPQDRPAKDLLIRRRKALILLRPRKILGEMPQDRLAKDLLIRRRKHLLPLSIQPHKD